MYRDVTPIPLSGTGVGIFYHLEKNLNIKQGDYYVSPRELGGILVMTIFIFVFFLIKTYISQFI